MSKEYEVNIYDPHGNKIKGIIKNGKTYMADGSRIPAGYTTETKGGYYKMGDDGKGIKVNSIPSSKQTSSNQSHNTNVYDQYGNRHQATIKDGQTYLSDGSRLPVGWYSETKGGYYKMGDDGKGVKVDGMSFQNPDSNYGQGRYDDRFDELINVLIGSQNQGPGYNEMFDKIMGMMPKYELPPTLTHEEARSLAEGQMNPLFQQGLKDALKQVERNALQSGFFGQLPNVDTEGKIAGDLELQKASAIAQLANQIVGQSEDSAYRQAGFQRQLQSDQLNTLLQALSLSGDARNMNTNTAIALANMLSGRSDSLYNRGFQERQYKDTRKDVEWEKGMKESEFNWNKKLSEAQLTGIFEGKPTMALTELTHRIGIDNKKIELMEKELNNNIAIAWENIKHDKIKIGQAQQRIGLQASGQKHSQSLSERNFMIGVKTKAFDMAMTELSKAGKVEWDPILGDFKTGNNINEGELLELWDSYTRILLGDISGLDFSSKGGTKQGTVTWYDTIN